MAAGRGRKKVQLMPTGRAHDNMPELTLQHFFQKLSGSVMQDVGPACLS
jgi:hypothetical protein